MQYIKKILQPLVKDIKKWKDGAGCKEAVFGNGEIGFIIGKAQEGYNIGTILMKETGNEWTLEKANIRNPLYKTTQPLKTPLQNNSQ